MPHTNPKSDVFIAFGGNKGDTKTYITQAIACLEELGQVVSRSPLFITKPEGHNEQNDFINGTLLLKTSLEPALLLKELKNIEAAVGRTPTFKNGPREIDLDIIFYDNRIVHSEALTIPHPRAAQREFVLLPLSFIKPNFIHPVTGQTVSTMLKELLNKKYPQKAFEISDNN